MAVWSPEARAAEIRAVMGAVMGVRARVRALVSAALMYRGIVARRRRNAVIAMEAPQGKAV